MNRRTEERVPVSRRATLTTLSGVAQSFAAEMADISGLGASFRTDVQLPAGILVRADLDDVVLLGEIVYCRQDGEAWRCGFRLEHSVAFMADLRTLNQSLWAHSPEAAWVDGA